MGDEEIIANIFSELLTLAKCANTICKEKNVKRLDGSCSSICFFQKEEELSFSLPIEPENTNKPRLEISFNIDGKGGAVQKFVNGNTRDLGVNNCKFICSGSINEESSKWEVDINEDQSPEAVGKILHEAAKRIRAFVENNNNKLWQLKEGNER